MSNKELTGQSVAYKVEARHSRAAPQLRRDVACAARRSFLDCGTLEYQTSNVSKKVLTVQLVVVQP